MQVINCQKQKDKKIRRDKNEKKKEICPETKSGNENKRNRKLGKEWKHERRKNKWKNKKRQVERKR